MIAVLCDGGGLMPVNIPKVGKVLVLANPNPNFSDSFWMPSFSSHSIPYAFVAIDI